MAESVELMERPHERREASASFEGRRERVTQRCGCGAGSSSLSTKEEELQAAQRRAEGGPGAKGVAQLAARVHGEGGMPGSLQAGLEQLSGMDLSDVRVRYNSPQPAQLAAHAYTQGSEIHVAPGQEQHLPHEGWHVVQQKQGRVRPTTELGGTAINDDPGLEREADVMGARALFFNASAASKDSLQRKSASAATAPVQGVFQHVWKDIQNFIPAWIDTDTGVEYALERTIPLGDGVFFIYNWVKPTAGGKSVPIRPIPGSVDQWAIVPEPERKKLDARVRESTPDVMPEMGSSSGIEEVWELGEFEEGTAQPYTLEEGTKALQELYSVSKLTTSFTVLAEVVPIEEGRSGLQERMYGPGQVWVKNLAVSDFDRPETRFENQESHTVAWTLVRNAVMRLAHQSVADLLTHFAGAFRALEPLVETEEGKRLLAAVTAGDILETALVGELPVGVWNDLVTRLITLYAQVYQMSTAATYKRGKAKGHGESHAMSRLREDEEALATSGKTRGLSTLREDVATLLDVQFRVQALGVQQYAFAIQHWIESLQLVFPALMKAKGPDLVAPVLDKALSPSFRETLDDDKVDTVRDLLAYYGYGTSEEDVRKGRPTPPTLSGTLHLPTISLQQLKTGFVANVSLAPRESGTSQEETMEWEGTKTTLKLDAYAANQLEIRSVHLGDQDRPKTKFLRAQKSHTVAWTLVRHHIMAMAGRPLSDLLGLLHKNFQGLVKDIKNPEGQAIAKTALETLELHGKGTYPEHVWQTLMSNLVQWYFIAYQVAESSSFITPEELGQALGHGEAVHMQVLRRNEFSLQSGFDLADSPDRVIQAATVLFDGFLTTTLDERGLVTAYEHWKQALEDGFPAIWSQGGKRIDDALLSKKVSDTLTLGQVVAGP